MFSFLTCHTTCLLNIPRDTNEKIDKQFYMETKTEHCYFDFGLRPFPLPFLTREYKSFYIKICLA